MKLHEWLRRVLVALVVFTVCLVAPGYGSGRVEGAPEPVVAEAMRLFEPQVPEYHELGARRRQEAVARTERVQAWRSEEWLSETSAEQRKQVRKAQEVRKQALDDLEDLVPVEYRQLVLDVATRYGIDPRLLAAMGTVESRWHAKARGSSGDSGLMQILPSTAAWISRRMGLSSYDLDDPLTNLSMAAWYLQALQREHGSWERALAAYNGGPRAAAAGSQHPYVQRVMRVYGKGSG